MVLDVYSLLCQSTLYIRVACKNCQAIISVLPSTAVISCGLSAASISVNMHFSKSLVRIICSFSGIPFVVQLLEYQVLFNLLASAAAAEISYLRTRQ